jgi:hypothetical protein
LAAWEAEMPERQVLAVEHSELEAKEAARLALLPWLPWWLPCFVAGTIPSTAAAQTDRRKYLSSG